MDSAPPTSGDAGVPPAPRIDGMNPWQRRFFDRAWAIPELRELIGEWLADPDWDLEETEGFEGHEELLYAVSVEVDLANTNRFYREARAKNHEIAAALRGVLP